MAASCEEAMQAMEDSASGVCLKGEASRQVPSHKTLGAWTDLRRKHDMLLLFLTHCVWIRSNPGDCSTPGFLSFCLEFVQIHVLSRQCHPTISSHSCRPLLLTSGFPSIRSFPGVSSPIPGHPSTGLRRQHQSFQQSLLWFRMACISTFFPVAHDQVFSKTFSTW